ncbi:MAG: YdcF family protein [Parasporobacterium sp.]|nr:YdcF family protein [Parasporobacterium sp.]
MFRFNTRKKKPKLYHELIILGIAVILIILASLFGGAYSIRITMVIESVFFAVTTFVFFDAFRKQVQYNPYSYNTIFYFGFGLFLLSVTIEVIVAAVQSFQYPDLYQELASVVAILSGSAVNYMIISLPFVLAFSIALFISNISLIRHETRRIQNFLGMILAVLMLVGEAVVMGFGFYLSGSQLEVMIYDTVIHFLAAVYLYFECMLMGSIVAGLMTAFYRPDTDADYIIILGCRVGPDGKPYPLLRGRIDKALEFYHRQLKETGKRLFFVPSGGKGSDETVSECECMKQYLLERGVPAEQILEENRAENTYENMLFSKNMIEEQNPDAKVLFSTTNYHVFRSGLMSRRVKMRAIGIGARTKWYFWPNASVREFFGLLQGHKLKQILVLAGLILSFVILTILSY